MGRTGRNWIVPTDTTRRKAVNLARKYLREGYGRSKAHRMAAKEVGYSVGSIYSWKKQYPVKRTTTVVHSHKEPTTNTTTSTSLKGVVVNHNLNASTNEKFRVLSVDLMTDDGNIITLTEKSLKSIVKLFG